MLQLKNLMDCEMLSSKYLHGICNILKLVSSKNKRQQIECKRHELSVKITIPKINLKILRM